MLRLFVSGLLVLGVFFLLVPFSFGYGDTTTHPALTEEIVKFYNSRFDKKVTPEQIEWMVQGSRLEDTPPRWVNHLYDPIQKIGWSGENLGDADAESVRSAVELLVAPGGRWHSAIDWVNNSPAQQLYQRYGGDRTWKKALQYYADGNMEEAYRTLGYVLHLLEDMGVPEHTRNDPHPHSVEGLTGETGSPYESYAKRWTRETVGDAVSFNGLEVIQKDSIEEYLEAVALYSNKYFFSKDTINDSKYEFPKIVREDDKFGYGIGEDGEEFPLVVVRKKWNSGSKSYESIFELLNKPVGEPVFNAYFERLAREVIQNGAGVIDLFHKQGEDAIVNKEFPARLVRYDFSDTPAAVFGQDFSLFGEGARFFGAMRGAFASAADAVGGLFSRAGSLLTATFSREEKVEEISLTGPSTSSGNKEEETLRQAQGVSEKEIEEVVFCPFETSQVPRRDALLLNEVAWMGTTERARSEWVEIRNLTGQNIDISRYQVVDRRGDTQISFPSGSRIGASGFYLLERGDDALPKISADIVFTGSIANQDEGLRLFDGGCNLLDEAVTGSSWPAGNNATKHTMERAFDFSWYTSANVGGTPRAVNTPFTVKKVQEKVLDEEKGDNTLEDEGLDEVGGGDSDALLADPPARGAAASSGGSLRPVQQCSFETSLVPSRESARINEVAWMGGVRSASDEWIELKNTSGGRLDISGWQVVDKGEQIRVVLKEGVFLPVGGFYLLERTDDDSVLGISADAIYAGGLSNSDEGLRLFDGNCRLIDEVLAAPSWPAGDNSSKGTMERKNDLSWQTSGVQGGTPRAENTVIQPSAGGSPTPPSSLAQFSSTSTPPSEESSATSSVGSVYISEFQVASEADLKYEFVELYNAGSSAVDLSGWDLKKRTSGGNFSSLVTNISSSTCGSISAPIIPARGYFLIASGEYNGNVEPDCRYIPSTSGLAGRNNSVVLMDGDDEIIDEVFYESLADDVSYERKALSGGVCVSSQGAGEYLGNGCDVLGSISDFEVRATPNPQNRTSLPEPRDALAAVSDFQIDYTSSTLELGFSWGAQASAASYTLMDITSGTSTAWYTGTSTSFSRLISEVGRDYAFLLRTTDSEGYTGDVASTTISVPSFLDSLYFYQDTRGGGTDYLLDMYYSGHPFVPDVYERGESWRAVVFYLNSDPVGQELLANVFPSWTPDDLGSVLQVAYDRCAGGSGTPGASLLLPDSLERCGAGGGLNNSALVFSKLEDPHLIVKTASSTGAVNFSTSDYVTVAFYSFYDSGGGQQTFKLAAVDTTRRYFQNSPPVQVSPSAPLNLAASFDEGNAIVDVSWASSTDADTLNNSITYEITYTTSSNLSGALWSSVGTLLSTSLDLNFGETYLIGARAKDDFGNISSSTEISYTVPTPAPPLTVSNIRWGYIRSTTTDELAFQFSDYNTLVPGYWTVLVFYLNAIAPDLGATSDSLNNLLNDDEEKLWVKYYGCQGYQNTYTPSLPNIDNCSGDFRNGYDPLGVDFPAVGEV
ncbi:MAG: lamin tail domain-containing protein, partial [bacterium]|nr:lamin tail domain-containing protein [bacterium]